jgi:hypothetical protein
MRKWKDIKMILKNYGADVDWVHLAQDKDHWQGIVRTVMNLQVP